MSEQTLLASGDRSALCRASLEAFTAVAFQTLKGSELHWAPYLNLIIGKLEEVRRGEIKNLIITLPPRGLKSFIVSVVLPAFILGHDKRAQIMCVSYGRTLADGFAADRQRLMQSALYRQTFGEVLVRSPRSELATAEGGVCRAVSMETGVTGKGAGWLIFDDPQKAQDVRSEKKREKLNEVFRNTFLTRRNDPTNDRVIIVMQRLHEDDFVGQALEMEGMQWELLNLPAIAERDERYTFRTPTDYRVFKRKEGEVLHPARMSREQIEAIRKDLSPLTFETQYQQRPAPPGGSFVRKDWFRRFDEKDLPPEFDEIVQSWDTADTIADWSDWTVCTTWGRLGESLYLLHVHREKMEFPELVRRVRRMADRFNPTVVLIEAHASGTQLVQWLRSQGFGKARAVKPKGDKETRLINQTALIESGRVWLPAQASWVEDYLHELILFPNGRNDDQVDSTSQALEHLSGWFEGKGVFEFMRQEAARLLDPPPRVDKRYWKMRCPSGTSGFAVQLTSGDYPSRADGTIWIPWPCAEGARALGWEKVDEYDPGPNPPPDPQFNNQLREKLQMERMRAAGFHWMA